MDKTNKLYIYLEYDVSFHKNGQIMAVNTVILPCVQDNVQGVQSKSFKFGDMVP